MKLVSLLFLLFSLCSTNAFSQESEKAYNLAAKAYQLQNFQKAEKIWSSLAVENNANAQYALAIMHLKKETLESSDKTAFDLLKRASSQQHVVAMFNLGVAYWEGTGTPIDQAKALNWWEIAARKNDSGAQYNLGLAYYIGAGRDENTDKAYYWVKQAAENGHPQAPALLETMVEPENLLVEMDEPTAEANEVTVAAAPKKQPVDEAQTLSDNSDQTDTSNESSTVTEAPVTEKSEPAPTAVPTQRYKKTKNAIVELKSQANAGSHTIATLKPATLVQQIETEGDWAQVQTPAPVSAWVYGKFVTDLGNTKAKIKGDKVNIRPAPSTDNAKAAPIMQLNNGDAVTILLKRNLWVQISIKQPVAAWVPSSAIEDYSDTIENRQKEWLSQAQLTN